MVARPRRRSFSAEYKLAVVREADAKSRNKSSTAKDGLRDLTELVRDVDELGKALKDVSDTVRQIRRKP